MPDEPPPVAVGDVWADADPRSAGRTIRIIEVDRERGVARAVVLSVARNVGEHRIGQRTRLIQLSRFTDHQRGYRRVPGGTPVTSGATPHDSGNDTSGTTG
jgi:hypothetical protein